MIRLRRERVLKCTRNNAFPFHAFLHSPCWNFRDASIDTRMRTYTYICIYISWRQRQMMHIKRSETRTRSPTGNNALMSRRRSDYGGFTLVIVISRRARVAAERETDFYRFFRSTSRDSPVQQSEIFSSCVFFFVRFDPINYFVISNSRKNCSYT